MSAGLNGHHVLPDPDPDQAQLDEVLRDGHLVTVLCKDCQLLVTTKLLDATAKSLTIEIDQHTGLSAYDEEVSTGPFPVCSGSGKRFSMAMPESESGSEEG